MGVADEYPDLASLANELGEMVLGPSYWLVATELITPVLAVPNHNATFYGPVLQADGFEPQPGMTVTARIGDVICGQTALQEWQDTHVYVLQVASRKEVEGCGTEGAQLLLQIDGRSVGTVKVEHGGFIRIVVHAHSIEVCRAGAPECGQAAVKGSGYLCPLAAVEVKKIARIP